MLLRKIQSTAELKELTMSELNQLAAEIREELIAAVSQTGGHLGSNLGVVELTIALHTVFESPVDKIVFDTGHQTYVHKMLTGRTDRFTHLRQPGGLSGYPSRAESPHDIVENSHASTALSWADGIAAANSQLQNSSKVIAVVGDGSLTGGMAWEAINNIANQPNRNLVIVVNDNGRSYSPTIGGLAKHLAALRTSSRYERFLQWGKTNLLRARTTEPIYRVMRSFKVSLQTATQVRGMFQDLGIKYLGPVNGHEISELLKNLELAKDFAGPVLVHVITEKGKGYRPAELDESEKFHGIGKFDRETGQVKTSSKNSWTSNFSELITEMMQTDPQIVAITAAMLGPTGLLTASRIFPDRVIDVGIAEQHAVTSAAGMAYQGMRPVIAVYASFLNRAFDQTLLDVALHNEPVTMVLDRAGVTGDDGPSHNGIWDIALLGMVPNAQVFAPWNRTGLANSLKIATKHSQQLSVIRFPKGEVDSSVEDFPDEYFLGNLVDADVVLVPVGVMLAMALEATTELAKSGVKVAVRAATQIQPIPLSIYADIPETSLVVTIEDGIVSGGFGQRLRSLLPLSARVLNLGVKDGFPEANTRATILQANGLTGPQIVEQIKSNLEVDH